jgi:DNA-binding response OmpR family regulator
MDALLIVGLNRTVLRQAFVALSSRGYELVRHNGSNTLRHIEENRYAAIAMDWDLSHVPAHVVVAQAKSQGIPTVVVCKSLETAFAAGEPHADVYLEKPICAQELCEIVITLIAANQQPATMDSTLARSAAAS